MSPVGDFLEFRHAPIYDNMIYKNGLFVELKMIDF